MELTFLWCWSPNKADRQEKKNRPNPQINIFPQRWLTCVLSRPTFVRDERRFTDNHHWLSRTNTLFRRRPKLAVSYDKPIFDDPIEFSNWWTNIYYIADKTSMGRRIPISPPIMDSTKRSFDPFRLIHGRALNAHFTTTHCGIPRTEGPQMKRKFIFHFATSP